MKPRNFSHILKTSAFLLTILITTHVHAHQLHLWAHAKGQTVEGYAYTPAGRISNATIIITDANNQPVTSLTTNQNGEFTYTAQSLDTIILTLDTGDGHRVTKTLKLHTQQPPISYYESEPDNHAHDHDHTTTPNTDSLDHRITEISQQLDQLKTQRRWQDIIGAVGYLIGITGIVFYFLGKKTGQPK